MVTCNQIGIYWVYHPMWNGANLTMLYGHEDGACQIWFVTLYIGKNRF